MLQNEKSLNQDQNIQIQKSYNRIWANQKFKVSYFTQNIKVQFLEFTPIELLYFATFTLI